MTQEHDVIASKRGSGQEKMDRQLARKFIT